MKRCHECSFPLGSRDLFCARCGAKQRRDKIAPAAHERKPEPATLICHVFIE
jgi:hypothetical protein